MVITETGAAKSSDQGDSFHGWKTDRKCHPRSHTERLHGHSEPHLKNGVTVESVNEALKEASIHGNLIEQIDYSLSREMVRLTVGNGHAVVVDAPATIVSADGKRW